MSLNGQWAGRQLSLAAGKQTTPTVNLSLNYQINIDFKAPIGAGAATQFGGNPSGP